MSRIWPGQNAISSIAWARIRKGTIWKREEERVTRTIWEDEIDSHRRCVARSYREQAKSSVQRGELDFLLNELGQKLNWAVYLQVGESVMLQRSQERGKPEDCLEVLQRRIQMFHEYYANTRILRVLSSNLNYQRGTTTRSSNSGNLSKTQLLKGKGWSIYRRESSWGTLGNGGVPAYVRWIRRTRFYQSLRYS